MLWIISQSYIFQPIPDSNSSFKTDFRNEGWLPDYESDNSDFGFTNSNSFKRVPDILSREAVRKCVGGEELSTRRRKKRWILSWNKFNAFNSLRYFKSSRVELRNILGLVSFNSTFHGIFQLHASSFWGKSGLIFKRNLWIVPRWISRVLQRLLFLHLRARSLSDILFKSSSDIFFIISIYAKTVW